MASFRFKRLEKYKTGGTRDKMEFHIPLPKSLSGKVYRWCPNEDCVPRLFLFGSEGKPQNLDDFQLRRTPGTIGTTCPYCGIDADDDEFNYEGDIEAILKYLEWAVERDFGDSLKEMFSDFNQSQKRGDLFSISIDLKSSPSPEPRAWREDLIRNLACDICGREYGVYAIALFCPDCGSKNLLVHFEREIELILQQIDLAEHMTESGISNELSYRMLGNAHEDVVTAYETYQKAFYRYMIKRSYPDEEARKLISKKVVGNRFQNMVRAKELYKNLSINPFSILTEGDLEIMNLNIEKRHVIGHNLSMADETYSRTENREKPGTTVEILADEISEFAGLAKKVVTEIERLM
jgi:hypothetical protein